MSENILTSLSDKMMSLSLEMEEQSNIMKKIRRNIFSFTWDWITKNEYKKAYDKYNELFTEWNSTYKLVIKISTALVMKDN